MTLQPRTMICALEPDARQRPIGKLEAHRRGVLHRAISVFVNDGRRTLLQRRAAGKYHSGGLWANACCSHPAWAEPAEVAAGRRLAEELGVSLSPDHVGVTEYRVAVGAGMVEHERVDMFVATVEPGSLVVKPDADEVAETWWAGPEALRDALERDADRFAPWFRIYLARWPDLPFLDAEAAIERLSAAA